MRPRLAVATASLLLLAGCSAGTGDFGLPDPVADAPCIVGNWTLDVADYSAQSEAWLQGINPDYIDVQLTGSAEATFGDGTLSAQVDLSTSTILLAGEQPILSEGRTPYTGSGDWEPGDDADTIDVTYWATTPDPGVIGTAESAGLPTVDFFAVPSLAVTCTADTLELTSTGAPLTARWHR